MDAYITNTVITAEVVAGAVTATLTTTTITAEYGNNTTTYVYSTNLPDGTTTGDFLRWNETTEAWEVAHEPIEFSQIVLTPAAVAVEDIEGGLWYKSTDKAVYVCADV